MPDFIANAGGVICAAVGCHGGTQTLAFQTIEEKIRANTAQVLEEARKTGTLPDKLRSRSPNGACAQPWDTDEG